MLLSRRLIPPLTSPAGSLPFPAWSVLLTPTPANTELNQSTPDTAPEQPSGSRVRCDGLTRSQGAERRYRPHGTGAGLPLRGRGEKRPPGGREALRPGTAFLQRVARQRIHWPSCYRDGGLRCPGGWEGYACLRHLLLLRRFPLLPCQTARHLGEGRGSLEVCVEASQERERWIWVWLKGTQNRFRGLTCEAARDRLGHWVWVAAVEGNVKLRQAHWKVLTPCHKPLPHLPFYCHSTAPCGKSNTVPRHLCATQRVKETEVTPMQEAPRW